MRLGPTRSNQSRRAFSIVEIVLGMGVVAALSALVLNQFQGETQKAEERTCRVLLKELSTEIEAWQIQHRRPWYLPTPPRGSVRDPWGNPIRVDPRLGTITSLGDPEQGSLAQTLEYEPYPTAPPGVPRAVRGHAHPGLGMKLYWTWPESQGQVIGFSVLRQEAQGFVEIGQASPSPPYEFVDPDVEAGRIYTYRLQALVGPGAKDPSPPASKPYSLSIPRTSPPGIQVLPEEVHLKVGHAAVFRVTLQSRGSPLRFWRFQDQEHALEGGGLSLEVPYLASSPGAQSLVFEVEDAQGQVSQAEVLAVVE